MLLLENWLVTEYFWYCMSRQRISNTAKKFTNFRIQNTKDISDSDEIHLTITRISIAIVLCLFFEYPLFQVEMDSF